MMEGSRFHIICGRECGFRVDDGYFMRKKRFAPGICPRCSAPIRIVEPYTLREQLGFEMVLFGTQSGRIREVE